MPGQCPAKLPCPAEPLQQSARRHVPRRSELRRDAGSAGPVCPAATYHRVTAARNNMVSDHPVERVEGDRTATVQTASCGDFGKPATATASSRPRPLPRRCGVGVPRPDGLDGGPDGGTGNLATIAGLFVGIASLLLALLDFLRLEPVTIDPGASADDLARALRSQWLEEARARLLRDPGVLSLTWTTTSRPVADEPRSPSSGARVLRVRMDGRLGARFDDALSQLAAGYAQLPEGQGRPPPSAPSATSRR